MKTVFITGASSGIGKETAKLFSKNGWNVIATMRKPELENELNKTVNVKVLKCDVTDMNSIRQAIQGGLKHFEKIDVLINNAGFYTIGVLESATEEQIKRQVETNLIGLINTTKEMLPHFRKQRSGTIINISSVAGKTFLSVKGNGFLIVEEIFNALAEKIEFLTPAHLVFGLQSGPGSISPLFKRWPTSKPGK